MYKWLCSNKLSINLDKAKGHVVRVKQLQVKRPGVFIADILNRVSNLYQANQQYQNANSKIKIYTNINGSRFHLYFIGDKN